MTVTSLPFVPRKSASRRSLGPMWLAAPGLAYLLVFLIVPSATLMLLSVRSPTGGFSLDGYRQMFTAGIYVDVLVNTFRIAAETTAACLICGYPVAFWLARMAEGRRRLVIWLVLLPFWMSALLKNFAWMVLFARRGVLFQILALFGHRVPIDILNGHAVVVFAMAHTMLPLAIMSMLPTLLAIDGRLSQAALTLGANKGQAFWRVFFPLSVPGLAAAGLLVFIGSLGFFITPSLLGSPHETVIGQLLITQVQQLLNWQLAGCIAVMLLVVTLVVCVIYDQLFGISAVSGDASSAGASGVSGMIGRAVIGLAAAATDGVDRALAMLGIRGDRSWVLTIFGVLVVATLLLPVVCFPPMAFSSSSFLQFPPPGFSLKWFETYFGSDIWIGATLRSFGIAFVTACLATTLAGLAALGVSQAQGRMRNAAFLVFMLPMIIPNLVVAVSLFYVFAYAGLVASNAGIALGHTVTAMPVVFIIMLTAFKNYDRRLDQAAGTLGASRPRTVGRVTLPILFGSVVAAFLFAFLHSFEELTIALFVGGGVKQTLPKQMWDDIILQVSPTLAAASVVVLSVVTLVFIVAERSRPR